MASEPKPVGAPRKNSWTPEELRVLEENWNTAPSMAAVEEKVRAVRGIHREPNTVAQKAARLGLPKRKLIHGAERLKPGPKPASPFNLSPQMVKLLRNLLPAGGVFDRYNRVVASGGLSPAKTVLSGFRHELIAMEQGRVVITVAGRQALERAEQNPRPAPFVPEQLISIARGLGTA